MKTAVIKFLLLTFSLVSLSFVRDVKATTDLYYKVSVETMFSQKDEATIAEKLRVYLPGISLVKINYGEKTLVIKIGKEVLFDNIKESFDKVGLRITRDEILNKYKE